VAPEALAEGQKFWTCSGVISNAHCKARLSKKAGSFSRYRAPEVYDRMSAAPLEEAPLAESATGDSKTIDSKTHKQSGTVVVAGSDVERIFRQLKVRPEGSEIKP